MKAYKTHSVITDSKQIILSDMPFGVGDYVEVTVSKPQNGSRDSRLNKLKALFKKTQSLPQIKLLTDDEIRREIEAKRAGR